MKDLKPEELARQLRKPTGELGTKVGETMNDSNAKLYDLGFDLLQFGDHERILEIGFGNGMFLSRYFKKSPNIQVFGHDYSSLMCEQAQINNEKWIELGRLKITCGDCLSMDYERDFFDKVFAINTIYFWDPLRAYLKEIKRVLKPGGQFLIGFRPKKNVQQFEFTQHGFILYEADEIIGIAEECGFQILTQKQNSYHKKSPNGIEFEAIDICLVLSK